MKLDTNHFSTNFTKWSNTLKQFVGKLHTNCLSVFDHFMGLVLIGLISICNEKNIILWFKFISILELCLMVTLKITKKSTCGALCDLRPFAQFKKQKNKNTHGGALSLVKLQAETCNFTNSDKHSWAFFTFLKLGKWAQITQNVTLGINCKLFGHGVTLHKNIFLYLQKSTLLYEGQS